MNRPSLDNPELSGRLRDFTKRELYSDRPAMVRPVGRIEDIHSQNRLAVLPAQPQAAPAPEPPTQTSELPRIEAYAEANAVRLDEQKAELKAKRSLRPPRFAFAAMAVVVFLAGIVVALYQLKTVRAVEAQTTHQSSSVRATSPPPDETPPDQNFRSSYTVPPDEPRFIDIPKISAFGRITKLGVDKTNQLQAPNNIFDAGWYKNSSKPADAGGAVLIDGHVSGPTKKGIFYNLNQLQAGDLINITRGDQQVFTFKVVKTQTYDAGDVDMAAALTPAVAGKLGLNLMTCTGKFDSQIDQYKQRLVVFAVAQ